MKKRILCLLLGCVMLLSAFLFVGCAQEGETEEEGADVAQNTGAKTVTLRLITETRIWNNDAEQLEYAEDIFKKHDETAYNSYVSGYKASVTDKTTKKPDVEKCLTHILGLISKNKAANDEYYKVEQAKAQYDAVEREIAKITKSNHKTNVDILFYTEDQYYSKLETSMTEFALEQKNAALAQRALEKYIKEYKAAVPEEYPEAALKAKFYDLFPEYLPYKDFSAQGSSASDDVYVKNELGIPELVYPEAEDNQLDIVYISGYDMYTRYIENEWILPLNSFINTTGKKLTYNISETLLNGVKVEGETYAIPNNVQIGEYTYMLVDKELADRYKHTYESFDNVADCHVFVNDVKNNHDNIIPIDSTFKECMDLFVWYWNVDVTQDENGATVYNINRDNNFSILGKYYDDPKNVGRGDIDLGFNNLLADKNYRDTLLCLKNYELNDCYRKENDERTSAAISFENGTYAMYRNAFFKADGTPKSVNDTNYGVYTDETGKEFFLYVAKYPKADEQSLYGNMYAVSANTKNTQACVEIITLINTDTKVRNLLQYGLKQGEQGDNHPSNYYRPDIEKGDRTLASGVYNYFIDSDTGMLKRSDENLYNMDIVKTGNCFIAYPEEGLPTDYWEDAKAQNNDAVIDPLAGFDFNERLAEYGAQLDVKQMDYCTALGKKVNSMINSNDTYDKLKNLLGENGELARLYTTAQIGTEISGLENIVRLDKLTNKDYNVSTGLGTDAEGKPLADPDGESPYTIYYKWLVAFNYLPAAK